MPVTTGLSNAKFVEITSGVQDGEQVIYAGHESLKDGDPVVPTEWGPNGPLSVPPATGAPTAGTVYTCPMHPEVQSDKPGDCPKCGMRLQPKEPPATSDTKPGMNVTPAGQPGKPSGSQTTYYCPMHPEVTSAGPGKCPKCGMDLVPKKRAGAGK